jgi:hypothetical protein
VSLPPTGPPAIVRGGDVALARAVDSGVRRIRFEPEPGSDLARALGLGRAATPGHLEVVLDALRLVEPEGLAVNAVVLGVPPDRLGWAHRRHHLIVQVDGHVAFEGRAASVVLAIGQFLRGADVVPRGHPGDGHAEVQVYALRAGERREMRRRLRAGAHVPHPRIRAGRGTRFAVLADRSLPLEVDGARQGRTRTVTAEILAGAYVLAV